MRSELLITGLLVLLLAPAGALAQRGEAPPGMDRTELVDPLDGTRFSVFVPLSANGLGGFDSDGCSYSKGVQPRNFEVVTSPTTLYTATLEDWGKGITEENKEPLLEMLLGLGRDVDNARDLTAADRYELAAAVARRLGRNDLEVGGLYLQGAWTMRDTVVGFLPGVQGASDAWSKLVETLPMVREVDNDRGRTIAFFDMARLAHRGGFLHERDDMLTLAVQVPDAGVGAADKAAEFHRRVDAEARLLEKARAAFEAGLAAKAGQVEERSWARFLVGDISRRLGEFDRARDVLSAVELDSAASDETKSYARDVLAVLKVQASARTVKAGDEGGSVEGE